MSKELSEVVDALLREGLKVSSVVSTEETPKIILSLSPSSHPEILSRASHQVYRALRVSSVITGKKWKAMLTAEYSGSDGVFFNGPVVLTLEQSEILK